MTNEEIREAVDAIKRASEAISRLPADFKAPGGWMNLDYELDALVENLIQRTDG